MYICMYVCIILLSLEEKGGMGGKQCGATKHNRAWVTKDHKYARPETSPVVVSECECVVRGWQLLLYATKGPLGIVKMLNLLIYISDTEIEGLYLRL